MAMTISADARAAERGLILRYAPAPAREGMAALLSLDDTLAAILRSTREPIVGQMRLAWWREALTALDDAPPPAEPVLRALAGSVLPAGVRGGALAGMTGGWERLLGDAVLDEAAMIAHARERGAALFDAMARVLGAGDAVAVVGEGWALADLARHVSDPATADRARTLAVDRLKAARASRWSRPGRPLGALALLARSDLAGTPPGSPRRVGRLLLHRIGGR